MENYPAGFDGYEGEDIRSYLFYLIGEIELDGEGLNDEEAVDELLSMTIREALTKGLNMEWN